ncbi:hypothetical protein F4804DRAFT_332366 [Jackrogersella minutella]|nr:hypothetical protein F4804DRAFT_332366 [Jackrogersella minutella]
MADTPNHHGNSVLPSPALSLAAIRASKDLPQMRTKPIPRGSRKEDSARTIIEEQLIHIARRYVKKFGIPDPKDELTGYESFEELCEDFENLIDLIWSTGTPSIQIPNLLNIANIINDYLPAFEPDPRATFVLLKKLDYCFASLIKGRDLKTGNVLSGFRNNGRGFTVTDMVRCKSLADDARRLIVMIMSGDPDVVNYIDYDKEEIDVLDRMRRDIAASADSRSAQARLVSSDRPTAKNDKAETEDVTESEIESENDESGEDDEETSHAAGKRKRDSPDDVEAHKRIEAEASEEVSEVSEEVTETQVSSPASSDSTSVAASPAAMHPSLEPHPGEKFYWLIDDDEEDDEEETTLRDDDEDMQLNVGQVYENTLLELGKSLGLSLVTNNS